MSNDLEAEAARSSDGTHFMTVALEHASRLINHGPTVLVTSARSTSRNVMAAAWSMPVEFTPPRIAIVIDKMTYTRELVMGSGAFGICLPGAALDGLTYAVGNVSGRTKDKFTRHNLRVHPGPVLGVPLLQEGCAAWLECRLIREPHTEDVYDTCFAEVVAAAADDRIFRHGRWSFQDGNADLQTIHHLGGGNFVRSAGCSAWVLPEGQLARRTSPLNLQIAGVRGGCQVPVAAEMSRPRDPDSGTTCRRIHKLI